MFIEAAVFVFFPAAASAAFISTLFLLWHLVPVERLIGFQAVLEDLLPYQPRYF